MKWGLFYFEIGVGEILLAILVIIGILEYFRQGRLMRHQGELIQLQKELGSRDVERARNPVLGARSVKLSDKHHRLRVFNEGGASAFNLRLVVPEDSKIFDRNSLQARFPHPELKPHDSLDLVVYPVLGDSRSARIEIVWEDPEGSEKREVTHVSF